MIAKEMTRELNNYHRGEMQKKTNVLFYNPVNS